MSVVLCVVHSLLGLSMPFVLVGIVNRTKAWWAGRKGPKLLQSAHDFVRLLRKRVVYSASTTPIFRLGPIVALVTCFAASMLAPMCGAFAPLQFDYDFVAFAYVLGLGRVLMMLSAMDVGSSFEGMGTAREASFSAFAEPALFLLFGTTALATGKSSFAAMLGGLHATPHFAWLVVPLSVALLILLQTEASRMPVDDPLTHLELTMIHEVMILDHSGPELAALQYAASLKLTIYAGMIAALLNPYDPMRATSACVATSVLLMLAVAVFVGMVESLVARLRMRWVHRYVLAATCAAGLALAVQTWGGGAP